MDTPRFARFEPIPLLAPYVECYWMLEVPGGQTLDQQRMPADGRIEVMFSFGGGSRRVAADGSDDCVVRSYSFVLGARGQGYTLEHFSAPRYVSIRFRPGGLSAFSRVPMTDLTDIYVDLDCIWHQPTVRRLEEQLEAASSAKAQAAIINHALLAKLQPVEHLQRLLYAVYQLESAQSDMTMPLLADTINMSQKHFERLFARYVGFRPSLFARVVRFQQAMYGALYQPETLTLGQLALSAGYYDQAHFSKDFKRFSGVAPKDFFSATHQFIQIATPAQMVEFLQDSPA